MNSVITVKLVTGDLHNIVISHNDDKHLHNKIAFNIKNSHVMETEGREFINMAHVVSYQVVATK